MARVSLQGVAMSYSSHRALHPTDLEAGDGEVLTLLGPSGCGKTTILRIVAGFILPTQGRVSFDGDDVSHLPPHKRSIGMVFQDYALFPHLTVAENITFSLKEHRWQRAAIRARVRELLELVRLPDIGDRLPSELSGGQQQRVAFARAVANPPRVLLMDEPLAALDLKLREAMQLELRRLQRSLGITTIFVTHDQTEAMNLSDRIAVMQAGKVVQVGTAREIYDRPASRFVAEFIGQINLLPAETVGQEQGMTVLRTGKAIIRSSAARPAAPASGLYVAVRPQHLSIANGRGIPENDNRLEAKVLSKTFNGNLVNIQVETANASLTIETRPDEHEVNEGDFVTLHWPPDRSMLLEA